MEAVSSVTDAELLAALADCPLGPAKAAAAVRGLRLLLREHRVGLTADQCAGPEPCGAVRCGADQLNDSLCRPLGKL